MKKMFIGLILLALATAVLSSCVIFLPKSEKDNFGETDAKAEDAKSEDAEKYDLEAEEVAVFDDKDMLPVQFTISDDGKFVYLLQDLEHSYSKISVSDSATELDVVYDADDFYIKNMACGDGFTAWTELTDDEFAVKCYNHETEEVTVVRSEDYDYDTDYQVLEIKAYKDCVYYQYYNNDEDYASIMCYDVSSGSEEPFMEADFFMPDKMVSAQFESLDINNNWLLCSQRTELGKQDFWMINLDDESSMLAHLNPNVSLVYSASFDENDNTLALYYWDTDSVDHIGTSSESAKITDWIDFDRYTVAYRDRIRYVDGQLYYIEMSVKNDAIEICRFCAVSDQGEDTSYYADAFSYFIAEDGSIYLLVKDADWEEISVMRIEAE